MPKQLIHHGRAFHLVPMKGPDGKPMPDASRYVVGYPDAEFVAETPGVVIDEEPTAYLNWSKAGEHDSGPSDTGFVMIEVEVTEQFILRLAKMIQSWTPDVPKPERFAIPVGDLSWRDLNVLSKAARQARDDAFGKPE